MASVFISLEIVIILALSVDAVLRDKGTLAYRNKREVRTRAFNRACSIHNCSNTNCDSQFGWNIFGSDWGCCGNYKGCCTLASIICYAHDAVCRCCDHWYCGPDCKVEPECRMKKANTTANTVNILNKNVQNVIGQQYGESQNDYRAFGNIERNTIVTNRTMEQSKRISGYNNRNKFKSRSDNGNIRSISTTTIIPKANISESMNLNNRTTSDVKLKNDTFYDELTNSTTPLYEELNRAVDVGRSFKSINKDKINTKDASILSESNSTTEEIFNDSRGPKPNKNVQNVTEGAVFRDSTLKYDAVASSLTVSLRFVVDEYDDEDENDYNDDLNDVNGSELETSTVQSDINNNSDKLNRSLVGKKMEVPVSSNISNDSSDDAEYVINKTRTLEAVEETKSQAVIPETNSSLDSKNNISMSSSIFRKRNFSQTDPITVSPKFHRVVNEDDAKKPSFLSIIYNSMFGVSKDDHHSHTATDITPTHPNYNESYQDIDEEGSGDI